MHSARRPQYALQEMYKLFLFIYLKDHGRDARGICIKERGAALEPGWASSQPALATTPPARAKGILDTKC
jgi:hypothetical protein